MINNLKPWSLPGVSALFLLLGSYAIGIAAPQEQEPTERERQLQRQLEDLKAELNRQKQPQATHRPKASFPPVPVAPLTSSPIDVEGQNRLLTLAASPATGPRTALGLHLGQHSRYRATAESQRKVAMLLSEIQKSKDESEKEELKQELKLELEKQYDDYLKSLEEPLAEMEERLNKLRDQFEKRKSMRDKMIDLQVETMWYEANGIRWPGGQQGVNLFPGQGSSTRLGTTIQMGFPAQPALPQRVPVPPAVEPESDRQ